LELKKLYLSHMLVGKLVYKTTKCSRDITNTEHTQQAE